MQQIQTFTPQTRELLQHNPLQYMFDAISENPGLAQIYTDRSPTANTVIVLLKRSIFIGGAFSEACLSFLAGEILNAGIRNRLRNFYITDPDVIWLDAIMNRFGAHAMRGERCLFSIKPEAPQTVDFDKPGEFQAGQDADNVNLMPNVTSISAELLHSSVANLSMIINEVVETGTYDSMDDFLARGFGYSPVINNRVCGFCTSEYPSQKAIAIGIEVLPEYQRQGYAKAMTRAFLSQAARRGLRVFWDCWKGNAASAATAMSCGLTKIADFPAIYLIFQE